MNTWKVSYNNIIKGIFLEIKKGIYFDILIFLINFKLIGIKTKIWIHTITNLINKLDYTKVEFFCWIPPPSKNTHDANDCVTNTKEKLNTYPPLFNTTLMTKASWGLCFFYLFEEVLFLDSFHILCYTELIVKGDSQVYWQKSKGIFKL